MYIVIGYKGTKGEVISEGVLDHELNEFVRDSALRFKDEYDRVGWEAYSTTKQLTAIIRRLNK